MRVALTFDAEHPDRPPGSAGAVEEILAALGRERVRATFFLQGRWVEAYPETARAIASARHLVGSHSHFHVRMPLLSDEGLRADIVQADRAIRAGTGIRAKPWFRCPWGHGHRDPRVVMALRRQGYRPVGWDVVAEDWEPGRTPEELVREVAGGVRRAGHDVVVLLHAWPFRTAEALPVIVRQLRSADDTFVTLEDLPGRDLAALADPQTAAENPGAAEEN